MMFSFCCQLYCTEGSPECWGQILSKSMMASSERFLSFSVYTHFPLFPEPKCIFKYTVKCLEGSSHLNMSILCIFNLFQTRNIFFENSKWSCLGLALQLCLLALPCPSWRRYVHPLCEPCPLLQLHGHSGSMLTLSN